MAPNAPTFFTDAQMHADIANHTAVSAGNKAIMEQFRAKGIRVWASGMNLYGTVATLVAAAAFTQYLWNPQQETIIRGLYMYSAVGVPVVDGVVFAMKYNAVSFDEGRVTPLSGITQIQASPAEQWLHDRMHPVIIAPVGSGNILTVTTFAGNQTAADVTTPKICWSLADPNGYVM